MLIPGLAPVTLLGNEARVDGFCLLELILVKQHWEVNPYSFTCTRSGSRDVGVRV